MGPRPGASRGSKGSGVTIKGISGGKRWGFMGLLMFCRHIVPIWMWSYFLAQTNGFGIVQEVLVYLKISTHFKSHVKSPKKKVQGSLLYYGVWFTMALLYCKGCVWIMAFLGPWILTSPVVVYEVRSNCPPSVFTTIRAHFHLSPISRWRLFFPSACVHVHVWSEDSGAVTFGRLVIQMH